MFPPYWELSQGSLRALSETCRQIRQEVFQTVLPARWVAIETVTAFKSFVKSQVFQQELSPHIRRIKLLLFGESITEWSLDRQYKGNLVTVPLAIPTPEEIVFLRWGLSFFLLREMEISIALHPHVHEPRCVLRHMLDDTQTMTTSWFYPMEFIEGAPKVLRIRLLGDIAVGNNSYLEEFADGQWTLPILDEAGDDREAQFFRELREDSPPPVRIEETECWQFVTFWGFFMGCCLWGFFTFCFWVAERLGW